MLKRLRSRKFAKKVWIVLAIVILPPFILWGSESLITSFGQRNYLGMIFGRKIGVMEFRDALQATRNRLIMQLGDEFFKQEEKLNLESQAWQRLILLAEVKKRGIKISDKEVAQFIQETPLFLRNGKFDFASYDYFVKTVFRLLPRQFEEQFRENLMLSRLFDEVVQDVKLSEEQIRATFHKENEEYSVIYLRAVAKDFSARLTAEDKEIQEYFQQNLQEFKRPVSFNLEFVTIASPGKSSSGKTASEEEVRTLYRKLAKSKNFRQSAEALSLKVEETGLFAIDQAVPGIGWSGQIMERIEKLKPKELMPPLKTPTSWYIVSLKERKEPYIPPFEEIKERVKETYLKIQSQQLARKAIDAALLKLKSLTKPGESDFEQVAKGLGLSSGVTELFKNASYIQGIGASDEFFSVAANLPPDQTSDVITIGEDFYLIKLKKHVPVDEEKFKQEKDAFSRQLILKMQQMRFLEFLWQLEKRADLKIFRSFISESLS